MPRELPALRSEPPQSSRKPRRATARANANATSAVPIPSSRRVRLSTTSSSPGVRSSLTLTSSMPNVPNVTVYGLALQIDEMTGLEGPAAGSFDLAAAAHTLQRMLSGYGGGPGLVQRALDAAGVKEPALLHEWDDTMVKKVVAHFVEARFPTVLVLNKADVGGDSDANIARICEKYDTGDTPRCFVASALVASALATSASENIAFGLGFSATRRLWYILNSSLDRSANLEAP